MSWRSRGCAWFGRPFADPAVAHLPELSISSERSAEMGRSILRGAARARRDFGTSGSPSALSMARAVRCRSPHRRMQLIASPALRWTCRRCRALRVGRGSKGGSRVAAAPHLGRRRYGPVMRRMALLLEAPLRLYLPADSHPKDAFCSFFLLAPPCSFCVCLPRRSLQRSGSSRGNLRERGTGLLVGVRSLDVSGLHAVGGILLGGNVGGTIREWLRIGGYISGGVLIALGIAVIVLGVWGFTSPVTTSSAKGSPSGRSKIRRSPSTPDWAGEPVDTGRKALAQAEIMREHTLSSTGGLTYAEMGRYQSAGNPSDPKGTNDPRRPRRTRTASRSRTVPATSGSPRRLSRPRSTWGSCRRCSRSSASWSGFALLLTGIGLVILAKAVFGRSGARGASCGGGGGGRG